MNFKKITQNYVAPRVIFKRDTSEIKKEVLYLGLIVNIAH